MNIIRRLSEVKGMSLQQERIAALCFGAEARADGSRVARASPKRLRLVKRAM